MCAVAHSCAHHGGGGAGSGTVVHAILVSRAGMGPPTQGQRGVKKYQGAKPVISHTASLAHLRRSLCLVARLSATLFKDNIYNVATVGMQLRLLRRRQAAVRKEGQHPEDVPRAGRTAAGKRRCRRQPEAGGMVEGELPRFSNDYSTSSPQRRQATRTRPVWRRDEASDGAL